MGKLLAFDDSYEWTAKITAELQYSSGTDTDIARAAWVSTKGERAQDETDTDRVIGLLSFLMRERHGTPFEHNSLTFLVRAPIFVWREHMRHRIGWSYNEESGRYHVLEPKFYLATEARHRIGKPGRYHYEHGSGEQDNAMDVATKVANRTAYQQYRVMLNAGIAPEVARMVLPVNIYSSAYVTTNVRGLMNFLELRQAPTALKEIRQLAHIYDGVFEKLFPLTHMLFHNQNVAP